MRYVKIGVVIYAKGSLAKGNSKNSVLFFEMLFGSNVFLLENISNQRAIGRRVL